MPWSTLTEIDEMITAVKGAITAVLTGGRSYQLNTGHGVMQVTRENLSELRALLAELENDRREFTGAAENDVFSWQVGP